MINFYKNIKITPTVTVGIALSGNIKDVTNLLRNLSYVFGKCRLGNVSIQKFAEAERAIAAVKQCKDNVQTRRRL